MQQFLDVIPTPIPLLVAVAVIAYAAFDTYKEWQEENQTCHPSVARAWHHLRIVQYGLICFGAISILLLSNFIGEDTLASWIFCGLYTIAWGVLIVIYTFRAGDKISALERETKVSC